MQQSSKTKAVKQPESRSDDRRTGLPVGLGADCEAVTYGK